MQAELAKKEALLAETRREAAERRVKLKDYEGIDVEEYRALKAKAEELRQKELEQSGNFEAAKQAIVESYEAKVQEALTKAQTLEQKYKSVVINDRLLEEAAKQNAMNPKQVAILLKDNIKLSDDGNVEVVDETGKTRFDEKGNTISIDKYVADYLAENKYMVRGVEGGSSSTGGEHKAPSAPKTALEKVMRGLSK